MRFLLYRVGRFCRDPLSLIPWLLFLAAALLLVVKGAANAAIFFLSILCTFSLIRDRARLSELSKKRTLYAVLSLSAMLFFEVVSQLGRQEIRAPAFDGPIRLLLLIPVYSYMVQSDCSSHIRALALGSGVGILLVAASLLVFPEYYWGYRAATYFVDPITLPCFTTILLGIFLMVDPLADRKNLKITSQCLVLIATGFVVLDSASRTSWVAFLGLMIFWLAFNYLRRPKIFVLGLVAFTVLVASLYYVSPMVRLRVDDVFQVLSAFASGRTEALAPMIQNSAIGHRLILLMIDLRLIYEFPWFGAHDNLPLTFLGLKESIPLLTEQIYEIKTLSGSHSEFLAQLVGKGVIGGLLTIWALFGYPVLRVLQQHLKRETGTFFAGVGMYGVVIPALLSSLTIQILNLKMTVSFYGLCLVLFLAYADYREKHHDHL